MKTLVVFAAAAYLSFAPSPSIRAQSSSTPQKGPGADNPRFQATVAAQKRINRYFHGAVAPRLKACWSRLSGKGSIEIRYLYAAGAKGWSFQKIQASRSDLSKDAEKAAVGCMQRAASGTSFPKEKSEKAKTYTLSWLWPVPFPPDAEQQVARMMGASGGEGSGCDGHGSGARCVTCSGHPQTCVYVCVGASTCEVQSTVPGGFDSICSEGGQCASGGGFGLVGTMVIY